MNRKDRRKQKALMRRGVIPTKHKTEMTRISAMPITAGLRAKLELPDGTKVDVQNWSIKVEHGQEQS